MNSVDTLLADFILTLLESDPWAAFLKLEKNVVKFEEFFTVFHTLAI
jgi:hypothetical protein